MKPPATENWSTRECQQQHQHQTREVTKRIKSQKVGKQKVEEAKKKVQNDN